MAGGALHIEPDIWIYIPSRDCGPSRALPEWETFRTAIPCLRKAQQSRWIRLTEIRSVPTKSQRRTLRPSRLMMPSRRRRRPRIRCGDACARHAFRIPLLGFLQPNARVSKLSDDRRKCPSQVFPGAGGGIENIPSLQTNADVATMFATFWIEEISASSMGRRQRSTTVTIAGLSVVSGSASSRRWRPPAPFPASFQSTAATSKPIARRAAQKGGV